MGLVSAMALRGRDGAGLRPKSSSGLVAPEYCVVSSWGRGGGPEGWRGAWPPGAAPPPPRQGSATSSWCEARLGRVGH